MTKSPLFTNSEKHYFRAIKSIPLGSQTFSKSITHFPFGVSPLYLEKSRKCYSWDVDNNKYVDLISSLAAVTLGYNNRKIHKQILKQLKKGVTLSLPGLLETEVAELIVELVPCAELVRFAKNGSDATSAAVRIARAYTGKDMILMCGYHGWQDWSIGTTSRNKGVPEIGSSLVKTFNYNDINDLKTLINKFDGKVAAVIMEPMNKSFPQDNFLEQVRQVTKEKNIVLVFDETITGFRFSSGGAQKFFQVTPDIATFGKGLANGFPLSAIVGKKEIMKEMNNIFFSGTFGGELLSLAAAKVVLNEHKENKIAEKLYSIGKSLNSQVESLISSYKLEQIIQLSGHETWKFISFSKTNRYSEDDLRTFFLQEMFKNRILILNSHNVTTSMNNAALKKIIEGYDSVLNSFSETITKNDLFNKLKANTLTPLFKIR